MWLYIRATFFLPIIEMFQINDIKTNQLVLYFPTGSGFEKYALEGKKLLY